MSMTVIRWLGLFLAGLSLGGIYFGGLWFTLRRFRYWRQPLLGVVISWLVRLFILLGVGAWLLKQSVASPLLVIVLLSAGMLLTRTLLIVRLLATVDRSVAITFPHKQSHTLSHH